MCGTRMIPIQPPKNYPPRILLHERKKFPWTKWASLTKLKKRCAMRGFKLDTNCTEASKRPTANRPNSRGGMFHMPRKKTKGRLLKTPKKISKIGLLKLWSWGKKSGWKRFLRSFQGVYVGGFFLPRFIIPVANPLLEGITQNALDAGFFLRGSKMELWKECLIRGWGELGRNVFTQFGMSWLRFGWRFSFPYFLSNTLCKAKHTRI